MILLGYLGGTPQGMILNVVECTMLESVFITPFNGDPLPVELLRRSQQAPDIGSTRSIAGIPKAVRDITLNRLQRIGTSAALKLCLDSQETCFKPCLIGRVTPKANTKVKICADA